MLSKSVDDFGFFFKTVLRGFFGKFLFDYFGSFEGFDLVAFEILKGD